MSEAPDIIERLRLRQRKAKGTRAQELWTLFADAMSEIRTIRAEREHAGKLVGQLREDLMRFIGSDPIICEGCGAPIDHDEEPATTADVSGCWGYVSDWKGAPCYRYRTKAGVERAWPPCKLLEHTT